MTQNFCFLIVKLVLAVLRFSKGRVSITLSFLAFQVIKTVSFTEWKHTEEAETEKEKCIYTTSLGLGILERTRQYSLETTPITITYALAETTIKYIVPKLIL